jgi:3-deoxy-7-phosphoheptulonate synthase
MKSNVSSILFITGPCSLESRAQMETYIPLFKKWGLTYMRAPVFKPRTHPDSFQGHGEKAFPILQDLIKHGFKLVIEACSKEQLESILPYVSIIQIGARNMQNFELLKAVGALTASLNPAPLVMLKRGFANNYEEWMASALYLERHGVKKENIILCERGSRNTCSATGVTLDFGLALKAKFESDYKVIVDPSHGSGDDRMVLPLAKAIMSMPFDGVMIESHPHPRASVSDAKQALSIEKLDQFFSESKFHQAYDMTSFNFGLPVKLENFNDSGVGSNFHHNT